VWWVCACALATDNETPRCSDQPKEISVMHAKLVATIAILPKFIFFFSVAENLPARALPGPRGKRSAGS
jgi:hypothetical protein